MTNLSERWLCLSVKFDFVYLTGKSSEKGQVNDGVFFCLSKVLPAKQSLLPKQRQDYPLIADHDHYSGSGKIRVGFKASSEHGDSELSQSSDELEILPETPRSSVTK